MFHVKLLFYLALLPFLPLMFLMPAPGSPRYSGAGSEGEMERIENLTKEQREEQMRFWSW